MNNKTKRKNFFERESQAGWKLAKERACKIIRWICKHAISRFRVHVYSRALSRVRASLRKCALALVHARLIRANLKKREKKKENSVTSSRNVGKMPKGNLPSTKKAKRYEKSDASQQLANVATEGDVVGKKQGKWI